MKAVRGTCRHVDEIRWGTPVSHQRVNVSPPDPGFGPPLCSLHSEATITSSLSYCVHLLSKQHCGLITFKALLNIKSMSKSYLRYLRNPGHLDQEGVFIVAHMITSLMPCVCLMVDKTAWLLLPLCQSWTLALLLEEEDGQTEVVSCSRVNKLNLLLHWNISWLLLFPCLLLLLLFTWFSLRRNTTDWVVYLNRSSINIPRDIAIIISGCISGQQLFTHLWGGHRLLGEQLWYWTWGVHRRWCGEVDWCCMGKYLNPTQYLCAVIYMWN